MSTPDVTVVRACLRGGAGGSPTTFSLAVPEEYGGIPSPPSAAAL